MFHTEELQQIQTTRFNKWNLIGGGGSISNDTYTFGIENGTDYVQVPHCLLSV